jgi:hypothetical protein
MGFSSCKRSRGSVDLVGRERGPHLGFEISGSGIEEDAAYLVIETRGSLLVTSDEIGWHEHGAGRPMKCRLLLNHAFCAAVSIYCLVLCIKGNAIHVAGVCAGMVAGPIAGYFMLRGLVRFARKGVFILPTTRHPKLFALGFFALAVGGGTLVTVVLLVLKSWYPQINWLHILMTFVVVSFTVLCLSCAVGIYCLEAHFGERFYLAKRHK